MTISTISSTITTEVTPGSGNYAAVLDILSSGAIEAPGGIYGSSLVSGISIINHGSIYGVTFTTNATLTNYGSVGDNVTSVANDVSIINLQDGGVVDNFGQVGGSKVRSPGVDLNHATLNNYGIITNGFVAVEGVSYSNINNFGTVSTAYTAIEGFTHTTINNLGTILSGGGVVIGSDVTVNNGGTISASSYGISGSNGADFITNTDKIEATTGVGLIFGSTLINEGNIQGVRFGVVLEGGSIENAGIISGATAISSSFGDLVLSVDPGAEFIGTVTVGGGHEVLELAADTTTADGSLNMGGSFSGFSTIDFDAGSTWSLEGSIVELAAGETINGFAADDTLVLDGFIASSASAVTGEGLVLSNGFTRETLDITGGLSTGSYIFSSTGGGTEVEHTTHIIDTTVSKSVTLGSGVYISPLTVTAAGRVAGGSYPGDPGIVSYVGGTIINYGRVEGGSGPGYGDDGILFGNGGTVINHGLVAGAGGLNNAGVGVLLRDGRLINTGTIDGGVNGNIHQTVGAVYAYRSTVQNYGGITGGAGFDSGRGGYGVEQRGGTFFNAGAINGGAGSTAATAGVFLRSGTLINAGTIGGGTYGAGAIGPAIYIESKYLGDPGAKLIVEPGAVFTGEVVAAGGGGSLEVAAGSASNTGSLDIHGTFNGFTSIQFDADAHWTVAGNTGELAGRQTISGFTVGDTLILTGFTSTSDSFLIGAGLKLSDGTITQTLDITGNFSTTSFQVMDVAAGTEIVVCYLRGTRITVPAGERAIEQLRIGDAVMTKFGGVQKIKWIGRQGYAARFIQGNGERVPVRIAAGALRGGLPVRDLLVSPGHSMLLQGRLVLAKALINGVTITQDEPRGDVHYYQIEFDTHDCVMAEGAWSESFADGPGLRGQFHNAAEFTGFYPNAPTPERIMLCAERPERGAKLAAALRPVVVRAARRVRPGPLRGSIDLVSPVIEGWAQDVANPLLPVLLEILAGDRVIGTVLACDFRADLAAAGIGAGRAHFAYRPKVKVAAGALRVRRKIDGADIFVSEDCRLRA